MKRTVQYLGKGILTVFLTCLMISGANAAKPMWTMTPAAGSNPTQTIIGNGSATVQYTVQNQSAKPKQLVILPLQGVTQTAPCQLAPRGQAGSSCTLNLAINGSALPASGIHGGPQLCQANPNGTANPNQCYQPSAANILNITRISVTPAAAISITAPVQQARIVTVSGMTPLSLTITNNANSAFNANAVTVSDKSSCPNLLVDDSSCTSVAPGASCTLQLSSTTPYAPCTITVSGSNTSNSPQTLIAFYHLDGLVFRISGGVGEIVKDLAQQFSSQWTSVNASIFPGESLSDGESNTDDIVADASCSGDPANCAAQRCRDIGPEWYLPAVNELFDVYRGLCANESIPCDFGGFEAVTYWSSSETNASGGIKVRFPVVKVFRDGKSTSLPVRCTRQFTP